MILVKKKIKQNIKRLCKRNRKFFMEFSKNYFCEKKKENLKNESNLISILEKVYSNRPSDRHKLLRPERWRVMS